MSSATVEYPTQVAEAVAAAHVTATGFSWRGTWHLVLPVAARRTLTPADQRQGLTSRLETHLYSNFYCPGGLRTESSWRAPSSHASTVQHVEQLSAANRGDEHFDPDWWVVSADGDELVVIKDGLRLRVVRGDCRSEGKLLQGVEVSVRTSKEMLSMTPGFYLVVGNAPGAIRGSAETLSRLYWNVTPRGAIALVAELTTLLNGRDIRFRMKALRDPATYSRCDAAVLYLSKENALSVWDELAAVYGRVGDELKPRVPAMTKALAPGLGIAEDPGGGNSFGLHRCGLIAQGLLEARATGPAWPSRKLAAVFDRFESAAVDIVAPYLGPGNIDEYPPLQRPAAVRRVRLAPSNPTASPDEQLSAALTVGRHLSSVAYRGSDWCTWLGYQSVGGGRGGVFGTTGPSLYEGTAGIAWFLAELSAVTGDAEIGATARSALTGAMRAALGLTGSFFTGSLGVAVTAAYAASLLGDPALAQQASDLLEPAVAATPPPGEWDLLTGSAGIAVGLLVLADLLGEPGLLYDAASAGERLVEAAERDPSRPGCSWPSGVRGQSNLVGLSHGTSGAVLALRALARATGRNEFGEVADQAVTYEQSWFDAQRQAWPDLRRRSVGGPTEAGRFPFF